MGSLGMGTACMTPLSPPIHLSSRFIIPFNNPYESEMLLCPKAQSSTKQWLSAECMPNTMQNLRKERRTWGIAQFHCSEVMALYIVTGMPAEQSRSRL